MKKIIILSAFFLLTSAIVSAQSVTLSEPGGNSSSTVCTGQNVTLTASFNGSWYNKTYKWYRGTVLVRTNSSNVDSDSYNITSALPFNAGDYSVKVWNYDSTASVTSNTHSLTVNPLNTLTYVSGQANQTVCKNTPITTVVYTTTGATGIGSVTGLPAGVTAAWASNTLTISGTPTSAGNFNYTIPLTGGCGTVNATGTITVIATNTVSAASSSPQPCINTPMDTITHTTGGATGIGAATGLPAGVTATWASNTITISGTPTASGTFNYSIPLTGGCGATINAATGTITVKDIPTLTLTSGELNQIICQDKPIQTIEFTLGGGADGASVNTLLFGLDTATSGQLFKIYGTPDSAVSFTVTATSVCPTNPSQNVSIGFFAGDSIVAKKTLQGVPYILIYPVGTDDNDDPIEMLFQWYRNGNPVTGANEQFYYPKRYATTPDDAVLKPNDVYKVRVALMSDYSCATYSFPYEVPDYGKSLMMEIYPNPNDGNFFVSFGNEIDISGSVLSIYSLDGKLVHSMPVNLHEDMNMNLALRQGFYFAKLTTRDGAIYTKKVVVE